MGMLVGSAVVGNVGLSVEVGGRMKKIVGEWGCRKNKMIKMVG